MLACSTISSFSFSENLILVLPWSTCSEAVEFSEDIETILMSDSIFEFKLYFFEFKLYFLSSNSIILSLNSNFWVQTLFLSSNSIFWVQTLFLEFKLYFLSLNSVFWVQTQFFEYILNFLSSNSKLNMKFEYKLKN